MNDNPMMTVPPQVLEMAERTVDQAEKAFDAFLQAASKSVEMTPAPAGEISRKTLSMTEQNMKAAFDHARKLLQAKDLQQFMHLQSEFVKAQVAAAQTQMKEIGDQFASASKSIGESQKFDK